jgi:hypothetical protein
VLPAHLSDVTNANRAAIRDCDDGVAHFVERLVAAGCLEAEAATVDVDRAARNARILALQRLHHAARRELQLGHARQIERDAQLARRVRPGLRVAHAVDRLERVLEVAREFFQLGIRRIRCDQRELHDVDQPGIHFQDQDVADLRRQLRAQRAELALHFFVFLFRIDEE